MDDNDVVKFDQFIERVWGIKPPKSERDVVIVKNTNVTQTNNQVKVQEAIDRPIKKDVDAENKKTSNINPEKKISKTIIEKTIGMTKKITNIEEVKDENIKPKNSLLNGIDFEDNSEE